MRPSSSLLVPPRTANTAAGTVTKMHITRCNVPGRISVSVPVLAEHFILQLRLSEGLIRAAWMSLWCRALHSKSQVMPGKKDHSCPNSGGWNLLPAGWQDGSERGRTATRQFQQTLTQPIHSFTFTCPILGLHRERHIFVSLRCLHCNFENYPQPSPYASLAFGS